MPSCVPFLSRFVQGGVDLLGLVGETEVAQDGVLALGLGVLHHLRIHLLELVGLAGDGGLEVLLGGADALHQPQVGVGVDGLGGGGGAEQLGHARFAVGLGLVGKGEIFAVGLGFPGKGGLEVVHGLGHRSSPYGLVFIRLAGRSCTVAI
jgi:hypothetical protein